MTTTENDKLRAALSKAREALEHCYNVTEWPGDGKTFQDEAIALADAALAAPVVPPAAPEPSEWIEKSYTHGRIAGRREALTEAEKMAGGILSADRVAEKLPPIIIPPGEKVVEEDDKPIWEKIADMAQALPDSAIAGLPTDGASQHDHYLYGSPKKPTAVPGEASSDWARTEAEKAMVEIITGRVQKLVPVVMVARALDAARAEGYAEGLTTGTDVAIKALEDSGYDKGHAAGLAQGRAEGRREGMTEAEGIARMYPVSSTATIIAERILAARDASGERGGA